MFSRSVFFKLVLVIVVASFLNTGMVWAAAENSASLPAASAVEPVQTQVTPPHLSGDPWERMETARKLATSSNVGPAITALVDLLGDDEPWIRAQAAKSLGTHGAQARSALKALLEAKGDEELMVRRQAGAAIACVLPPGEYEVLTIAESARRQEDKALIDAVDKTALGGTKTAAELISKMRTNKRAVRKHIAQVLARMNAAAVMPALVSACQDEDVRVRTGVQNTVRIMGTKAVPTLSQILRKGDERQRADAAFLLGEVGGKEARQSLLAAKGDMNEAVREEVEYALEHMAK